MRRASDRGNHFLSEVCLENIKFVKMKVVCLLLTLAVVLAASSEDTSNFIVGGEDATIQQYPYMAGVFNLGLHTCGGTIISASNVLTVRKQSYNVWVRFKVHIFNYRLHIAFHSD